MKYKELLEACWKGYHKEGMKTMFGKRYPNCVKNKKSNEDIDTSQFTEAELEEDLKKWFREKWVRFGPDGKIRGECGGRDSSEGKPKCLPASKAHALGKKGRSSSAAKKRREDPNPERRGPAKNVATKTRSMKEQGYQEHEPPTGKEESNLGRDVLGIIRNAGRINPANDFEQELVNQIRGSTDPSSANVQGTTPTVQILRRLFGK
jgi:hypothetical protein